MRYALHMSSSFVFQPHVAQSDGTVITPDIAIDRVYATMTASGLEPEPVARLTSAAVIQEPDEAPLGAPAVVLVAASFGMLVSVGVIARDVLPLARAAWRYDDIRDHYEDTLLRSWTVQDGQRTGFVTEKLSALMAPSDAMKALGNAAGLKPGTAVFIGHPAGLGESVDADRFEVALEGVSGSLKHGFDLERIG
ncbi:MAG: DUF2848 family protein [Alphaproteobacteria bacterium]